MRFLRRGTLPAGCTTARSGCFIKIRASAENSSPRPHQNHHSSWTWPACLPPSFDPCWSLHRLKLAACIRTHLIHTRRRIPWCRWARAHTMLPPLLGIASYHTEGPTVQNCLFIRGFVLPVGILLPVESCLQCSGTTNVPPLYRRPKGSSHFYRSYRTVAILALIVTVLDAIFYDTPKVPLVDYVLGILSQGITIQNTV